MILLGAMAGVHPARSQQPDSSSAHPRTDSIHRTTFAATNTGMFVQRPERTIDLAITGGAGYYRDEPITPFQATANADFYARTKDLDFMVGVHWGFSDPSTKGLSLGLRFPIKESEDESSGFYGDAGLLFMDNGLDSGEFSTGIRAALAMRNGPLEFRVAGELRRFPFGGDPFQAWGGIELGFVINVLREDISELTPKDSIRQEMRYIATSNELEQLSQTESNEDIDRWLDQFWQKRNITGSPRNDAREEYMRRVRMANEKYSSPREMGVSTDRGRVLLLYGKPDRIENENSVYGADRKFELWIDENRVQGHQVAFFLFISSQYSAAKGSYEGHGEYREIYSNVAGEASEGVPNDVPSTMQSYIEGFR